MRALSCADSFIGPMQVFRATSSPGSRPASASKLRLHLVLVDEHKAIRCESKCSPAPECCAERPAPRILLCCPPDHRSALVVFSPEMLRFPYHTRYELIEFAVFTLAARAQGLMPLHGACVGHDGRGLLLFGDSGAGKSTASLHCLLRGMNFLAEDSMFVTPDTMFATGIANFLHVRCDSLHSVPDPAAVRIRRSRIIRRRSGVEKYEVDLRRAKFDLAASPLKVARIVFISEQAGRRGVLLTPLRRYDTLVRFKKSQPYAIKQPGWTTISRSGLPPRPRSHCAEAAVRRRPPTRCMDCWRTATVLTAERIAEIQLTRHFIGPHVVRAWSSQH